MDAQQGVDRYCLHGEVTVTGKGKYERNPKNEKKGKVKKRLKIGPMRTKRRSGGIKKGFEGKQSR